jgi:3D (Asp-Asp-Asp) domain-containing protein
MRIIALLIMATLTSCTVSPEWAKSDAAVATESKCKKIRARITYYSGHEDKWGSRVADPKTKRAKRGVTVAAHPNFKFGTKLIIPNLRGKLDDGKFIVQDRGTAVTSKKASNGKNYVFDVFVASNNEVKRMCKTNPEYMDVFIY